MALYFVSDMHMDDERPDLQAAFFAFIEAYKSDMQALYLLGDVFEYWVGDDHMSPQSLSVIRAFRTLTDSGVPVFLQHGNRDFLLGKRFLGLTGITLLPDIHTLQQGSDTLVLCHGDQLCTQDREYQRARYWLRKPSIQWLLRRLPLMMRLRTAEKARRYSKQHQSGQVRSALDVTPQAVTQLMAETDATILIHGHTHQPKEHPMRENKRRIVLGSWTNQGGVFVKATPDGITSIPFSV